MSIDWTNPSINDVDNQTVNWIVGWIMLIVLIGLFAKTKTGYVITYYALCLLVLFLVLTQYKWIARALAQTGLTVKGNNPNDLNSSRSPSGTVPATQSLSQINPTTITSV